MRKMYLTAETSRPRTKVGREIFLNIVNSTDRHLVVSGPLGTGKTMLILYVLHHLCMTQPNLRVAIARLEQKTLYTTLVPSFKKMLQFGMRNSPDSPIHVYGGEKRPKELHYYNGSIIVFTGFESDKFFGGEWSIIYCNELRMIKEEPYNDVSARLRGGGYYTPDGTQTYIIISDTNPSSARHWIKQRAEDGRMTMRNTTLFDNPHYAQNGELTPEGLDYRKTLEASYVGYQFDRYVKGLWVGAEGLIFPMYDPQKFEKKVDITDIPSNWVWSGSVDYGTNHPASYGLWATSPDKKETCHFKEIYRTGLTASRLGDHIIRLHERLQIPRRIRIVGDSASDHNQTLRDKGLRVIDAKKEVLFGIDIVRQWLLGVGERKVIFNTDSLSHDVDQRLRNAGKPTKTTEEFDGYTHKPVEKQTTGTEKDDMPWKEKGGDDGMDKTRYHLVDIFKGPSKYRPVAMRSSTTSSRV